MYSCPILDVFLFFLKKSPKNRLFILFWLFLLFWERKSPFLTACHPFVKKFDGLILLKSELFFLLFVGAYLLVALYVGLCSET